MSTARRSPGKTKFIIGAAVIAAAIAVALSLIRGSRTASMQYQEVRLVPGNINVTILSTGIVQPENRLEIKPPIAGRVDKVLVDEGEQVKKGEVLVLMSSSERAALLDAARGRGPEALARWETFYRPTPIMAPIDGTIILRSVEPGQSFTTQEAVLVMSDRLTVKAQVDETDIAQIKQKQQADVILDAYPDTEIPAHVDKIAYDATTINSVTTYIVDVLPEETPPFMRSGMTANVRFLVEAKTGILILPSNAVKNRKGRHFVLVPSGRAMASPVEKEVGTGATDGKHVEITQGLEEGAIVLVPQGSIESGGSAGGSNPFSPFGGRKKR